MLIQDTGTAFTSPVASTVKKRQCSTASCVMTTPKPDADIKPGKFHREHSGTLGMVPLIIKPIYTLYSGYLLGISPF